MVDISPDAVDTGTAQAWAALGGDPALVERIAVAGRGTLPARLPVMDLARATVAACSLAGAELAACRNGGEVPAVRVDDGAVTAAFLSDRLVRLDGAVPATFAPLSRFWPAADGWVRTHGNYPHHRARLLGVLGLPDDAGEVATAAAVAERPARELEDAVYAAGGLAVAVRTVGEWAVHPQGAAAAAHPLLVTERIGGEGPRRGFVGSDGLPCAGVRVLDLTRVLAGPTATKTLALLGADVLRIDPPGMPETQDAHNDTGMGKRSALLDLASPADRRVFEGLLATADVVVTGYRPGALEPFGLTPEELAERRPGLVVARLSAWGRYGPWAERRGFDSLVQAASGIALIEGDGTVGALPTQALDHGTGYLLAAGVLRALTEQHRTGGARLVEAALSQTAAWLVHGLPAHPAAGTGAGGTSDADPAPWLTTRDGPLGTLWYARPAVSFAGAPGDWATPAGRWGADAPAWRE